MIKQYNRLSFVFGIPGIIMQIFGRIKMIGNEDSTLWPMVMLLGTALLMIGLAYYAKAKRRHWAWCFMGFLSIIGLTVLAYLKDKSEDLSA